MLDEYIGHIVEDRVTEKTAAHACDGAHETEKKCAVLVLKLVSGCNADHGKAGKPRSIKPEHGKIRDLLSESAGFSAAFFCVSVLDEVGQKGKQSGDDGVNGILEALRRMDSENQVADDTASDGRDDADHDNAECVQLLTDRRKCTRDTEGSDAY